MKRAFNTPSTTKSQKAPKEKKKKRKRNGGREKEGGEKEKREKKENKHRAPKEKKEQRKTGRAKEGEKGEKEGREKDEHSSFWNERSIELQGKVDLLRGSRYEKKLPDLSQIPLIALEKYNEELIRERLIWNQDDLNGFLLFLKNVKRTSPRADRLKPFLEAEQLMNCYEKLSENHVGMDALLNLSSKQFKSKLTPILTQEQLTKLEEALKRDQPKFTTEEIALYDYLAQKQLLHCWVPLLRDRWTLEQLQAEDPDSIRTLAHLNYLSHDDVEKLILITRPTGEVDIAPTEEMQQTRGKGASLQFSSPASSGQATLSQVAKSSEIDRKNKIKHEFEKIQQLSVTPFPYSSSFSFSSSFSSRTPRAPFSSSTRAFFQLA